MTTALDGQKIALNSARIIVIRVAYKTHVDDLRESPALTIIELRQKKDMPG